MITMDQVHHLKRMTFFWENLDMDLEKMYCFFIRTTSFPAICHGMPDLVFGYDGITQYPDRRPDWAVPRERTGCFKPISILFNNVDAVGSEQLPGVL